MMEFDIFCRIWETFTITKKVAIFERHSDDEGDIQIKPANTHTFHEVYAGHSIYEIYQSLTKQEITPEHKWFIRYGNGEEWILSTTENLDNELTTYYLEEIYQDRECWECFVDSHLLRQIKFFSVLRKKFPWAKPSIIEYYVFVYDGYDNKLSLRQNCNLFQENYKTISYNARHNTTHYAGEMFYDDNAYSHTIITLGTKTYYLRK